jgi:hypothetical protein
MRNISTSSTGEQRKSEEFHGSAGNEKQILPDSKVHVF